jgi:hypothetical protein
MFLRRYVSDLFCNRLIAERGSSTFSHCGTGKAGDGSWQLEHATEATQVAKRSTEGTVIVLYPGRCDELGKGVVSSGGFINCWSLKCCQGIIEDPTSSASLSCQGQHDPGSLPAVRS